MGIMTEATIAAPPLGTDVIVHWLDAHTSVTDEQTAEEIAVETLLTFKSRGILVRHDGTLVAVAADERSDGRYRGITYIPAILVHKIETQRPAARKRAPRKPKATETLNA